MSQEKPTTASLLEEWKARYESYQSYCGQYLSVFSVTTTAWLVGLGYALNESLSCDFRG